MSEIPAGAALRDATRAVHERLHALPAFAALAAGTLDRHGYVALLGRLYGFHAPVEAALAAMLGQRLAPEAWQRAHLLRADLASFGVGEQSLARLPRIEFPALPGEPAAMGCLYVVEGSTLGGRQLSKRLDGVLPLGALAGRSFLQGAAQPGHLRWAALRAELDAIGADPACRREMIAGAASTFAQFELWFADS